MVIFDGQEGRTPRVGRDVRSSGWKLRISFYTGVCTPQIRFNRPLRLILVSGRKTIRVLIPFGSGWLVIWTKAIFVNSFGPRNELTPVYDAADFWCKIPILNKETVSTRNPKSALPNTKSAILLITTSGALCFNKFNISSRGLSSFHK